MKGFSAAPRRDTSRRRQDEPRPKNSSRGHREAVARSLKVGLLELSSDGSEPRRKGRASVRQQAAMSAAMCCSDLAGVVRRMI
jgi:hypothetical protein